jgi:hypothetical protein
LPARAQGPFAISPEPADKLVREALDTPYAEQLLKAFAASVRREGDAACLRAKGLDDAALVGRGRALLQRYGVQMMKIIDEVFDRSAYEAALAASAGPNAAREIERLRNDRDVRAFEALYRPAQLAKRVDLLMENFDRYVLISRIKLRPVSPEETGDAELMKANPTEAVEAAAARFLKQKKSRRLERYLDFLDADAVARKKGFKAEAALKNGPWTYFAGADRDLAELCIGRR